MKLVRLLRSILKSLFSKTKTITPEPVKPLSTYPGMKLLSDSYIDTQTSYGRYPGNKTRLFYERSTGYMYIEKSMGGFYCVPLSHCLLGYDLD